MRRGRLLILVGIILILGLVAVVVVLQSITTPPAVQEVTQPAATPTSESAQVVITTQRIARGDVITEDVVQLVSIPKDQVIQGMFTEIGDVIDQVARFDFPQGTFLTQEMITEDITTLSDAGSDAALLIDPGMVAVPIPITRLSSVAYGLRPGDGVNVIVTLLVVDLDAGFQSILPNNTSAVIAPGPNLILGGEEQSTLVESEVLQNLTAQTAAGGAVSPVGRLELDPTLGQPFYIVPSEPQRPRLVSQTLLQNVMVLQVGTFPLEEERVPEATETPVPVATEEGQLQQQQVTATPIPPPEPPDIITLVVSPQDAVTLNYLLHSGAELSLAMRSAKDDSVAPVEAVTLQFLLDQYNIPIPAKLPFGVEPRIDELELPTLPNDIVPTPEQ